MKKCQKHIIVYFNKKKLKIVCNIILFNTSIKKLAVNEYFKPRARYSAYLTFAVETFFY